MNKLILQSMGIFCVGNTFNNIKNASVFNFIIFSGRKVNLDGTLGRVGSKFKKKYWWLKSL